MKIDWDRYNKDQQLARSERRSYEFLASLQQAGTRKDAVLQRLIQRRDATSGWVKKEYAALAQGLDTEFRARINAMQDNESMRYASMEELRDFLNAYEQKVEDHEQYMKTAGSILFGNTQLALKQYETSRKVIFGGEVTEELRASLQDAEQKLADVKNGAARAGLGILEEKETDAQKDWNTVDTKRVVANAEVQELKKKVDVAKKAQKDLPTEQAALENLRKEKTDKGTEVADKKKELEKKERNARDAGVDLKPTRDETVAEIERKANAEVTPLRADPTKTEEVKKRLEKRDADIVLVDEIEGAKQEIKVIEDRITEIGGDASGLIKRQAAKVKKLETDAKPLPALENALKDKQEEEQRLVNEAQPLKKDYDEAKKAADKVRNSIAPAEQAVADARKKLEDAKKLVAPRTVTEEQRKEFIAQANATLNEINEEGFHLRNQFERRTGKMNARLLSLARQKTDILEDLARERGLAADHDSVRKLLGSIKGEKRYLMEFGDDEARLVHLHALETELSKKLAQTLKAETDTASDRKKKVPFEEQKRIIEQEMMALEEYQPETGKARIDELKAKAGELVKVQHAELRKETNAALVKSDGGDVPEETLEKALALLRKEGNFIKKYRGPAERFAYLQEEYAKITQKIAQQRGVALHGEAQRVVNTGTAIRRPEIDTLRNLIKTEQNQGEGVDARARREVEALKNEQLPKLATETDRLLIPAINSPERAPKMQALTALLEEARLLFTHFLDSSADRRSQLKAVAETLLRQIAEQSDVAAERATAGATNQHFREAYGLLSQERSFLMGNRDIALLVPDRLMTLQSTENALDSRMLDGALALQERALKTKAVADVDAADQFLQLVRERAQFTVPEQKVVLMAVIEKAQRTLSAVRKQSAEREGLERADREIDVQEIIDSINQRFYTVKNDSPQALQQDENMRQKMLSQMQKDLKTLEDNLFRGTETQKIKMQSLITQIADASWEQLRTQEEKEKMFKQNFSLMVQEAKAKVTEMRQPLAGATLEKYTEIIKAGQAVLTKAQGYVDVADSYRMDRKQVEALSATMAEITAEIDRMRKVVKTFKKGGTQRS